MLKRLNTGLMLLGFVAPSMGDIIVGQVDDFEDGTVMGWGKSPTATNPAFNVPFGGPDGAGDNYLQNDSTGTAGPGSKQIIFNQTLEWTGDFTAAIGIRVDMRTFGTGFQPMRIALNEGIGFDNVYASANAFLLPDDGQWHTATFLFSDLVPATDSPVPTLTLAQVLSNVGQTRILAAPNPTLRGDTVAATVDFDNIVAIPEPATWIMALLGAAVLATGRLRRA